MTQKEKRCEFQIVGLILDVWNLFHDWLFIKFSILNIAKKNESSAFCLIESNLITESTNPLLKWYRRNLQCYLDFQKFQLMWQLLKKPFDEQLFLLNNQHFLPSIKVLETWSTQRIWKNFKKHLKNWCDICNTHDFNWILIE